MIIACGNFMRHACESLQPTRTCISRLTYAAVFIRLNESALLKSDSENLDQSHGTRARAFIKVVEPPMGKINHTGRDWFY